MGGTFEEAEFESSFHEEEEVNAIEIEIVIGIATGIAIEIETVAIVMIREDSAILIPNVLTAMVMDIGQETVQRKETEENAIIAENSGTNLESAPKGNLARALKEVDHEEEVGVEAGAQVAHLAEKVAEVSPPP